MSKKDLLFYEAYEEFYTMASTSAAFRAFCKDAFGEDFSQDGFSDVRQIDRILPHIPCGEDVHVLDIGCGNGKMLGYLQKRKPMFIRGFDYSEAAVRTARELHPVNSEFKEGVIGEIEYPEESFDVIVSMDTMYFAKDMSGFVAQIKKWMKEEGTFFVGYQEGDVMPKTENVHTTELAKALVANGMKYEVGNITKEVYELLKRKREAAILHEAEFEAEGHRSWFEMLIFQTEYAVVPYEEFEKKMARYLFVAKK